MSTDHQKFDNQPFQAKDSSRFYHNATLDAACTAILNGIRTQQGLMLLIGEAGLGKTQMLHRCTAEADDIHFILLNDPQLDFPSILNHLSISLGLPDARLDVEQQSSFLWDALAAYASRGQAVALLIDDAHQLRVDVLRRLWDFVETGSVVAGQRLQVVLAGLPEIEGKLRQPELRPLQESLHIRHRLERLTESETSLFLAHQIRAAGHADSNRLSPGIIKRFVEYGQGVPRAITLLCDTVLLFASLQTEHEITVALVDEAARSCFLSDQAEPSAAPVDASLPAAPADSDEFDFLGPDLNMGFDFPSEWPTASPPSVAVPVKAESVPATAPAQPLMAAQPADTADGLSPAAPEATSPPASAVPLSLRSFMQLLDEVAAKQDHKDAQDREIFREFHRRYQWLARSGPPKWLNDYEQRMTWLTRNQQPILATLAVTAHPAPESGGVLCVLLINPRWWLHREIRARVHSTDLEFANGGQAVYLRLLDGRDAQPVYLEYRQQRTEPGPATLQLELDLLDHRGTWHAYRGQHEIRLLAPRAGEAQWGASDDAEPAWGYERFWTDSPALPADRAAVAGPAAHMAFTLPLELVADDERADRLRAAAVVTSQALSRGAPLTRALLLVADATQAPARIELVSRPFMILGRYNPATGAGFGDFALGFVPDYTRISRLHAVICALGDQLALMPASDGEQTYTCRNGQRLERGRWCMLETDDSLDICDLYHLKLTLAWDRHGEKPLPLDWDPQEPRDKFGHYLLDLVEILHQRDQHAGDEQVRANLRNRYTNLMLIQDRIAELNGIGNPGSLLYARFERDDDAGRQVIHYYIPKWLSLGSSPEAGLQITADGVAALHAELLFREGMYWIQNLAEPGSIRVGCHGLETNEVLALEAGDVLTIGAARFEFEAY